MGAFVPMLPLYTGSPNVTPEPDAEIASPAVRMDFYAQVIIAFFEANVGKIARYVSASDHPFGNS